MCACLFEDLGNAARIVRPLDSVVVDDLADFVIWINDAFLQHGQGFEGIWNAEKC